MKRGPRPRPISERFWAKVDRREADECWPWTGATDQGYGVIFIRHELVYGKKKMIRAKAHRIAYELRYGAVDPDSVVMHRCDNRPCCNPGHLRLGTVADNNRDRSYKGRGRENRQWGSENANAKLTEGAVRAIVAALEAGMSQSAVAAQFGIKQPQVSRIARREQWAHLWEEP